GRDVHGPGVAPPRRRDAVGRAGGDRPADGRAGVRHAADHRSAARGGMSERGIPTAAELVAALREVLADEVMPNTTGALRFDASVAANVAGIVERELELGEAAARAHRERLAQLGFGDDAQLAAAIRSGDIDDRVAELVPALLATAVDDLRIANPRHIER